LVWSQSPAGIWSTACRRTGSTFVYTRVVRPGDACSSRRWVTAVGMPFYARIEQKVFRRSWNFRPTRPASAPMADRRSGCVPAEPYPPAGDYRIAERTVNASKRETIDVGNPNH